MYAFLRIFPDSAQLRKYPYEREIYYLSVAVEASFIGTLIVAGVWLTRFFRRGVTLSNYLFTVEIAFWLAYSLFSLGLKMHGGNSADLGMSMGAVAGVGGLATGVQLITGYPLIAAGSGGRRNTLLKFTRRSLET
jgi:hypothetical protein